LRLHSATSKVVPTPHDRENFPRGLGEASPHVAILMLTMYDDGLRKALKGVTTFEEVLRVTREA